MRFICWILLMSTGIGAAAQDLDFRDYRRKNDNFLKIREKDIRGDVATFAMAGIVESMGKPPLASIPVKQYGNDFITFEGDNIKVTIKAGAFDAAKHNMMIQDKHLLKIDKQPYYGNQYGTTPTTFIESVTVIVNGDTVAIPPAAYSDLYNPMFSYRDASGTMKTHDNVYISGDKQYIYIYMLNPAGTGNEYTWVIQDKKYLRRVVDFGFLK